ncbi:hypothetical protein MLD38_026055 [Melastoma candidum]|uniref:Uncharacterized protein n=1 Tax=Melastoma candidum TaxID=119954 RepID=A0ACB9NXD9_9MYRT|nr:hypothetical protein MLD38_026055 [Melastoma candidum]
MADSTNDASPTPAVTVPASETGPAVPKETKFSWGDVVDESPNEEVKEAEAEELNIKSLTIDESKKKINDFADDSEEPAPDGSGRRLDDAEDSSITAVTSGDTPYSSAKTFEDLNLSAELLKGIYVEMKFQKPSKIQAISLPMILTPPHKDLIAQAHNGSGKTTCFVLGMLSRVDPNLRAPQALCVCPTRELAIQNMVVLQKMGKYTGILAECAIPMGTSNHVPVSKRPPVTAQVVIGTPGTIKNWMLHKKLGSGQIKILVFDEADHMLAEDGFRDDSLRIIKDIEKNSRCQVLLFSATFNDAVRNFVTRVTKDGNQLFVKKEELSLEALKQFKVHCPDELAKVNVIKGRILELGESVGQTIIFVHSRHSAATLHKALVELGYEVTTIQGALRQEDRNKIIQEFQAGLTQVLISTDLLARGFDQQQVNLVINYTLPVKYNTRSEPDYEVYLHRIGRAGRFGRKGAVFNLICDNREHEIMAKIEQHFAVQVKEVVPWDSEEAFKDALKEAGLL